MNLYPFKLRPIFKERIWGGEKIPQKFNFKNYSQTPIGEAWVLSTIENNETIIENGELAGNTLSELLEIFMDDLIGEENFEKFETTFPLLIKIIDTQENLSLQVHPNDYIAEKKHNAPFGKSEAWYVIESEPEAQIFAGFSEDLTIEQIHDILINNKNIIDKVNKIEVVANDIAYIPAGLIHSLGKGLLVAEIQQSCDITYRLYDWERDGQQKRELHINDGLNALNPELQPEIIKNLKINLNKTNKAFTSPYFTINVIEMTQTVTKNLTEFNSFVVYLCIDGEALIEYENKQLLKLKFGDCIFVPACIDKISLIPLKKSRILEIY